MQYPFQIIIRIQRVLLGECKHEVTVKNINRQYHVRVLTDGQINQEAICSKENIGITARSLLRMEDKCGNISKYAHSARFRSK